MTRIIDLHQDLALSYIDDPQQWSSFDYTSYTSEYPTNVWSRQDYINSGMNLIWWVIRPYSVNWDMKDIHKRKLLYSNKVENQLISQYQKWVDIWSLCFYDSSSPINNDQVYIVLHIEWCDGISSIDDCKILYKKGVRSLWFVWNFSNALSGCNTDDKWLTWLWYDVVEWANENRVLIDTAHMNHNAMMETLNASKKPIINSHSNLISFSNHPRNVTDIFIKKLANTWGLLWLSLCKNFIQTDKLEASIDVYCSQIQYVRDNWWDESIWFGSDYHGLMIDNIIPWCEHISKIDILYDAVTDRFGSLFAKKFFVENAKNLLRANDIA